MTATQLFSGPADNQIMRQPERKTAETHRDGEAARAAELYRASHPPRRKRYTIEIDLDAVAPPDAEPNAPRVALDV